MPVYGCSGELSVALQDVHAVLDQFGLWNKDESHPLAGRLDLGRIGMSGHSFGAVTTQAVSGQVFPIGKGFTDPRINAAVLMSPSTPRAGGDPKKAFGEVKIPWMVPPAPAATHPSGNLTPKSRLTVFPACRRAGKYQLVLDKAEHSALGDRELPGEAHRHNPNHHRAILAVTTAFWDAYPPGGCSGQELVRRGRGTRRSGGRRQVAEEVTAPYNLAEGDASSWRPRRLVPPGK